MASPTIMVATTSPHERLRIARVLGKHGWTYREVSDAREAMAMCGSNGGMILVIDSGLLDAITGDPEWRLLRRCEPNIPTVVRGLIPHNGLWHANSHTFWVHPDDGEGLGEAIHSLQRVLEARNPFQA